VMPPFGAGPAQGQPPQQPPAARVGPGSPVIPVGGPGTPSRGGPTPLPGGGRGGDA
jgi:hypothetical protein